MIVVRVELWSAVTKQVTELARLELANTSGVGSRRDYLARTLRGRSTAALNKRVTQRAAEVKQFPSQQLHVWNLVARALKTMGYDDE